MGNITDYLKQIISARYGKDVRQAIHDGIQQCYYDGKAGEIDLQARQDIESLEANLETVEAIAKGRNRARVFTTTEAMEEWLSASENIGVAIKGDNLYIVELEVPDWWIAEVLTEADAETGFYYKIAKLETQKVDLTTIESDIAALNESLVNLRNIRVSDVLDANSNPFPPNAFLDSALSLGYAHGSLMGLNIGNYIPILTMRWYETSEVIRTVQIAFDGITTHTRYSVSATEWGAWKSGATNSDLEYTDIPFTATNNASFLAASFIRRRSYDGGVLYNINCTNVSGDVYSLIRIATTTVNPGYTRTFPCHIMDKQGLTKGIGIVMWYGGAIYLTAPVTVETTDTIRAGN